MSSLDKLLARNCRHCISSEKPMHQRTKDLLESLVNGSLVRYKNKVYFLSRGMEGRIVTTAEGNWFFVNKIGYYSPFAYARAESIEVIYRGL